MNVTLAGTVQFLKLANQPSAQLLQIRCVHVPVQLGKNCQTVNRPDTENSRLFSRRGQRRATVKFFREQLLTKTSSALAGPRASARLADPFCRWFFLRPPGLGCNNRDTSRMLKSLWMSYAYCSHINHTQNTFNTIPMQFCIRDACSLFFMRRDGFSISLCTHFAQGQHAHTVMDSR